MTDEVYISIPQLKFKEGSSFSAKTYFRTDGASSVPSTAHYRVDCLTTGKELTDWTSLTPAASIVITITATDNEIQDQEHTNEKKQLTVASNRDTATQVRETVTWRIMNNRALPDS